MAAISLVSSGAMLRFSEDLALLLRRIRFFNRDFLPLIFEGKAISSGVAVSEVESMGTLLNTIIP
jgi:hypothetical protein